MKNRNKQYGFTLIELMISLAIMAIVFVAVGTAFDAAFKNYDANVAMNDISTAHRNIVNQMSAAIRTAYNDPDDEMITVSTDGSTLLLTNASRHVMQYRYASDTEQLLVSIDGGDEYVMLDNVSPVSDSKDIFELQGPPVGGGFAIGTVGKVEINFKSSQHGIEKVVSTAAIPRNIIYGRGE